MSKSVVVIGGGIIGLCSAFYLIKQGHQVTIIDQSNLDSGASYVNAGYLTPSHVIPLSAPGAMLQGLIWMLDKSSPFYIKPRLERDFIKWALSFKKSCNQQHVLRSATVLRDISQLSQELLTDIKAMSEFNFHYDKKGLLILCQTDKTLEEELKHIHLQRIAVLMNE